MSGLRVLGHSPVFPAGRGLFSFCVRWADEYGKRDFCHGFLATESPCDTLHVVWSHLN